MYIKATLLSLVLAMVMFSCKKSADGDDTPESTTQKKLLTKITQVGANQTAGTAQFTTFTYDSNNLLIGQKNSNQDISYIYKQGNLFQMLSKSLDGPGNTVVEITFEGNMIQKSNFKGSGPLAVIYDLVFIYQGGKMIRTERIEDRLPIYVHEYQYSGENVSTTLRKDNKYHYKYEYTYDDKKNINFGLGKDVLYAINQMKDEVPSLNNIKTEKYTLLQDGKILSTLNTSYEYTYDADGYPITCIRKSQHSSQSTATETKFSYEYKVVE